MSILFSGFQILCPHTF